MASNPAMTKRSKALVRRETFSAYMFLLPTLIIFTGFVIVPMALCLFNSFFNYTSTTFEFIGLQNYQKMFTDAVFLRALLNTLLIVVVSVPVVTVSLYG